MLDCRYYDLCCFTDDSCNGEQECPKREHCQFYRPMPDVKALLELADEIGSTSCDKINGELTVDLATVWGWAQAIRDSLGVGDA